MKRERVIRFVTIAILINWPPDRLTIWSIDHLTTWSIDHLINWPPDLSTTWSIYHLITWPLDQLTTWSIDNRQDFFSRTRRHCSGQQWAQCWGEEDSFFLIKFYFHKIPVLYGARRWDTFGWKWKSSGNILFVKICFTQLQILNFWFSKTVRHLSQLSPYVPPPPISCRHWPDLPLERGSNDLPLFHTVHSAHIKSRMAREPHWKDDLQVLGATVKSFTFSSTLFWESMYMWRSREKLLGPRVNVSFFENSWYDK